MSEPIFKVGQLAKHKAFGGPSLLVVKVGELIGCRYKSQYIPFHNLNDVAQAKSNFHALEEFHYHEFYPFELKVLFDKPLEGHQGEATPEA